MRALLLILACCLSVFLGACSDNRTPYGPDAGEAQASSCFPNLDGRLERSEMPTQLGTSVDYLVARDTEVDLSGDDLDLRSAIAGEEKFAFAASELGGAWFSDEFPAGSIAVPLDIQGQSLGILRSDETAIQLIGIVSTDPEHTLLHYQIPIDLYRFPLTVGQAFSTESPVTGTLAAVPYNGSDRYNVSVEGISSVALPHLRFTHSFRVHTQVTSDSGAAGVVLTRQQLSFVSECFGEITRVLSQDNETRAPFTSAAELWRFSL